MEFSEGTPKVVAFTHIRILDLWCYQGKLLGMWDSSEDTPEVVVFTCGCPGVVVFSEKRNTITAGYVVFCEGTPEVVVFTCSCPSVVV